MKCLKIKTRKTQWGFALKIVEQSHFGRDFCDFDASFRSYIPGSVFKASNGFRLISNGAPSAVIRRHAFWVKSHSNENYWILFDLNRGECDRRNFCTCLNFKTNHVCYGRNAFDSHGPISVGEYIHMLQVAVKEYNEVFRD